MKLELGVPYDLPPIPHVPEHTALFDTGSLKVGVEFRVLDAEVLRAAFTEEERARSSNEQVKDGSMPDTEGVSLHVFDQSGAEYLRFDCFKEDPHYHYIWPGEKNLAIAYDVTANGEMLAWVLSRLRDRLPEMLSVPAPSVGATIDVESVRSVLPAIEMYARSVGRASALYAAAPDG